MMSPSVAALKGARFLSIQAPAIDAALSPVFLSAVRRFQGADK